MKYKDNFKSSNKKRTIAHSGDLLIFSNANEKEKYGVCLVTYECLVSLKNPGSTWSLKSNFVNSSLENGILVFVPDGVSVTLTQDQASEHYAET